MVFWADFFLCYSAFIEQYHFVSYIYRYATHSHSHTLIYNTDKFETTTVTMTSFHLYLLIAYDAMRIADDWSDCYVRVFVYMCVCVVFFRNNVEYSTICGIEQRKIQKKRNEEQCERSHGSQNEHFVLIPKHSESHTLHTLHTVRPKNSTPFKCHSRFDQKKRRRKNHDEHTCIYWWWKWNENTHLSSHYSWFENLIGNMVFSVCVIYSVRFVCVCWIDTDFSHFLFIRRQSFDGLAICFHLFHLQLCSFGCSMCRFSRIRYAVMKWF